MNSAIYGDTTTCSFCCNRALEAVLFYHPAAWWLSRRIDLEREHCCDDLVVKAGHDRVVYSSALLHVAELSLAASAVQLVAPAFDGRRRSALRRRIERVLNVADEPAVKLKRPGVLALVLLALCRHHGRRVAGDG